MKLLSWNFLYIQNSKLSNYFFRNLSELNLIKNDHFYMLLHSIIIHLHLLHLYFFICEFAFVKDLIKLNCYSVPSYIWETFYCTIARYGTRKVWNYFTEKVTSIDDEEERRRLLSSFACFQAPWVLQSWVLNHFTITLTLRILCVSPGYKELNTNFKFFNSVAFVCGSVIVKYRWIISYSSSTV